MAGVWKIKKGIIIRGKRMNGEQKNDAGWNINAVNRENGVRSFDSREIFSGNGVKSFDSWVFSSERGALHSEIGLLNSDD